MSEEPVLATVQNMKDYAQHGLIMFDTSNGAEYSANPNDYWDADPTTVFLGDDGDPMILVVKRTSWTRPEKD